MPKEKGDGEGGETDGGATPKEKPEEGRGRGGGEESEEVANGMGALEVEVVGGSALPRPAGGNEKVEEEGGGGGGREEEEEVGPGRTGDFEGLACLVRPTAAVSEVATTGSSAKTKLFGGQASCLLSLCDLERSEELERLEERGTGSS